MRIVIALGGNALLQRGQPMSEPIQRENIRAAVAPLATIAREHQVVMTHGNGPQVGLLALQAAAYTAVEPYSLDVLDAESEGMIGYLIEQELFNQLHTERAIATLLTQVEVACDDPAFQAPTKPIGPRYSQDEAARLARQRGWAMALDTPAASSASAQQLYRRVVASPRPRHILELQVIQMLVERNVLVICAGGGGIPVARNGDGSLVGAEAVIDKDRAGALLAQELHADAYLMLTDVDAVYTDWGAPTARAIRSASPQALEALHFAAGSMGPKVEAACAFARATGGFAAIGSLMDSPSILRGAAGTRISMQDDGIVQYER